MTEQEQIIAIAEFCGWVFPEVCRRINQDSPERGLVGCPPGKACTLQLPDYLHDLNAVHEAEMLFLKTGDDCLWIKQLYITMKLNDISEEIALTYLQESAILAHATASQRCEALLRMIGKWV